MNQEDDFCTKLPQDIIVQILRKLPAQTLIQLRCVSKYFNSLISHPDFIDLHLSTTTVTAGGYLFSVSYDNFKNHHFFFHDSLTYNLIKVVTPQFFHRYDNDNHLTTFVGYDKGVLCFLDTNLVTKVDTLILWNPLIGKFSILPSLPDFCWCPYLAVGFGFDHKNLDFKAVSICYTSRDNNFNSEFRSHVFVYGLKNGSWRSIEQPQEEVVVPCSMAVLRRSSVFVNGVVHWLASKKQESMINLPRDCIIAFDLVNEVLKEIDFPQQKVAPIDVKLLVLGGEKSLALFFQYSSGENWSMWSMDDYGNVDSWTKKYDVVLPEGFVPVIVLNDGNIVAQRNMYSQSSVKKNLILVDVEKNVWNDFSGYETPPSYDAASYVPSLALLDIGRRLFIE